MLLQYNAVPGDQSLLHRDASQVVELDAPDGLWYPPIRSALEWSMALVMLLLTGPVILLAAAVVRLTSSGPALYQQRRIGRGGREFTMYKIRSMHHDCERGTGAVWSVKGDQRITRVGQFLRKTHLDELPQLWNVLCGEMSLIGPRPERPEFVEQLAARVPMYLERLKVRPGVTGLAQVKLPPDTDVNDVRQKLALDLYYVRMMGPWLDFRIMLCTALKVVGVPFTVLRRLIKTPKWTLQQRATSAVPFALTAKAQIA